MSVFYSFHYGRDVSRVQLIRNMGVLEGQRILNAQEWESIRRKSDSAIENWIAEQMKYKSAVIVLIGEETYSREWVLYEIQYAWEHQKPLLGIRIHGLADFNGKADNPGPNPFDDALGRYTGSIIPVYDPTQKERGVIDTKATYRCLRNNLSYWSMWGKTR